MRSLSFLANIALFLLGMFLGLWGSSAFALDAGQSAINFSLASNSNSQLVSLSNYNGKVVYLDFWASWCTSCRHSLSWLNELHQKYSSQGLEVVSVNLDSEQAAAKKALSELGLKFTVLFDPQGQTAERYGLETMPSSYLLDQSGKVIAIHSGFNAAKTAEIEKQIKSLLKSEL